MSQLLAPRSYEPRPALHFANELTTKSIDYAGHRGSCSLADEVKVEHALDSPWLKAVDQASCLVVEEGADVTGTQWARWSGEARDVVISGWCSAIDSGRSGAIDERCC